MQWKDEDYQRIKKTCIKFLDDRFWHRHLDDMIQFCALKFIERECNADIEWLCKDYLRTVGLLVQSKKRKDGTKTFKLGAYALENSESLSSSGDDFLDYIFGKYEFDDEAVTRKIEKAENKSKALLKIRRELYRLQKRINNTHSITNKKLYHDLYMRRRKIMEYRARYLAGEYDPD